MANHQRKGRPLSEGPVAGGKKKGGITEGRWEKSMPTGHSERKKGRNNFRPGRRKKEKKGNG